MTPAIASLFPILLAATALAQSPPHIEWQRTVEDALAEQERTGLPLLVVFNTKGEVFNDRFRTHTYKTPEFIDSMRGYVCFVGSPDRHTERDHDALGNRVECPDFPGCTCGEHIANVKELFARWFGDNAWAPHHYAVTPAGKVLFDRYADNRMEAAISAIARHGGTPPGDPLPAGATALLQRRDAAARRAVEGMYRRSALAERERILRAAASATNEPHDLLRMALFSENDREFEAGAAALAELATAAELPLVQDALARTKKHRERLVKCVYRLAKTSTAAKHLHAYLTAKERPLLAPWCNEWRQPAYDVTSILEIEQELDRCEAAVRTDEKDHAMRLRLAIAQLAFAEASIATGNSGVEFWLADAIASAKQVDGDALLPEAQAVRAVASWLSSDADAAYKATNAAQTSPQPDRRPNGWLATRLIELDVQFTTRTAYGKAADPEVSLAAELARVRAGLGKLQDNPWATESAMLTGIGLLEYAGLRAEARELLDRLVRRFPASAAVHDRWRARQAGDYGVERMRQAAGELAAASADRATAEWFAGYAALGAAEQDVRDQRRDVAIAAYTDAIERFARSVRHNETYADSAHHYSVLALAGRAMQLHEAGKSARAVADLVRCRELREQSLHEQDGLKQTPRGIATRVRDALAEAGKTELAARLEGIAL